jgi:choice-of-anchor B domain-containing protein
MARCRACFCCILLLMAALAPVRGQLGLNVDLYGQYNPGDGRASGSWGYAAPDGTEYALLGAQTGTAVVRIAAEGLLEEVAFIPGFPSNWREIAVVGQHAYVVTEGNGSPHYGMQVISLEHLPDTAFLAATYHETFTRGHIIQADIFEEAPFVYVCGTTATQGVHILDVSDPLHPVEVGLYQPGYYIHDCHVRGDLLFAAAFFEATVDVLDISDRSNPQLIYRILDPGGNTHSVTTTADRHYLFVADELDGLPGRIFNIENLAQPFEVATYTANPFSMVHNPYIFGDYAYIAHNAEGFRVVDIADPSTPVEVGFYDTFPMGMGGGNHGLWSAWPYLPSGKIIGGNREDGLYVWTFNGARAGRFYGQVVDSLSRQPLFNALVSIAGTNALLRTDFEGRFRHGYLPGTYTMTVTLPGYAPKTLSVALEAGSQENLTIELSSLPTATAEAGGSAPVRAFPNPVAPGGRVVFAHAAPIKAVRWYDAVGRPVQTHVASVPSTTFEIAWGDWPAGLYWFALVGEGGRVLGTGSLAGQ